MRIPVHDKTISLEFQGVRDYFARDDFVYCKRTYETFILVDILEKSYLGTKAFLVGYK